MTPDEIAELIRRARYLLQTGGPIRDPSDENIVKSIKFFGILISHYMDGEVQIFKDHYVIIRFGYDSGKIRSFYGGGAKRILETLRLEMVLDDLASI